MQWLSSEARLVFIGGVDTKCIGLRLLRSRMSIIRGGTGRRATETGKETSSFIPLLALAYKLLTVFAASSFILFFSQDPFLYKGTVRHCS